MARLAVAGSVGARGHVLFDLAASRAAAVATLAALALVAHLRLSFRLRVRASVGAAALGFRIAADGLAAFAALGEAALGAIGDDCPRQCTSLPVTSPSSFWIATTRIESRIQVKSFPPPMTAAEFDEPSTAAMSSISISVFLLLLTRLSMSILVRLSMSISVRLLLSVVCSIDIDVDIDVVVPPPHRAQAGDEAPRARPTAVAIKVFFTCPLRIGLNAQPMLSREGCRAPFVPVR